MNALIGALALFLLGLVGARLSFTAAGMPLGARFLFITGAHFLLVGFLLGPVIGLLTRDVIYAFYPLLALGLAWVGLLFGLQLEVRQLQRFPRSLTLAALLQAGIAFLVFYVLAFGALLPFFRLDETTHAVLLAAAATACVSSPLGVSTVAGKLRGPTSELLLYFASLDGIVGIVALQLIFSLYHPLRSSGLNVAAGAEWIVIAVGVAAVFAIFLLWLTRPKPGGDELMLFLLGAALFLGGACLYLGVSTLFVAMLAGAVIGNLSPLRRRIFTTLRDWEKPIYVILLLLLGALVGLRSWIVLPLAMGYAIVRVIAKLAGGWVSARAIRPLLQVPDSLGLGLITQGGMSLAIALAIVLAYGGLIDASTELVDFTSAVVIGVVLSEVIGPFLTRHLLNSAGELPPPEATTRTAPATGQ